MTDTPKLTAKQQMFVREYLVDLNATQAAIRAGYSAKWAGVNADKLLKNTKVSNAIQIEMDKRAEKVSVTAEDVLESILRIRSKAESADRHGEALKANELLGKHLKMFTDKVEHTGSIQFERVERVLVKP